MNTGAVQDELEYEKSFLETSSYKLCQTNSSFHVKKHSKGKV